MGNCSNQVVGGRNRCANQSFNLIMRQTQAKAGGICEMELACGWGGKERGKKIFYSLQGADIIQKASHSQN